MAKVHLRSRSMLPESFLNAVPEDDPAGSQADDLNSSPPTAGDLGDDVFDQIVEELPDEPPRPTFVEAPARPTLSEAKINGEIDAHLEAMINAPTTPITPSKSQQLQYSDDEDDVGSSAVDAKEEKDPLKRQVFSKAKNVFILSWSGRPIFSRYGDESELAGFMGVISAIISNISHQKNNNIRSIISGKHKFVFAVKGPLYFVAVSSRMEESVNQIVGQLDYLHLQIQSVLTSGFVKILESRPSYDLRKLICDTENLMQTLIRDFGKDPSYLFDAVHCLRLTPARRNRIGAIMKGSTIAAIGKNGVKNPVLFSILLAGKKLVTMVRQKDRALHYRDLLILIHCITNVVSFQSSDSWVPICLPKYDPKRFLYAHISFLEKEVCLVQMSLYQESFHQLHSCKEKILQDLQADDCLSVITEAFSRGEFSVREVGTQIPEFRHFLYKSERLSQLIEPRYLSPYKTAKSKITLFRLYQHIHSRIHQPRMRHLVYHEVSASECIFGMVSPGEFEFYAVFTPFVTKEKVIAASNRCLRWIHREETSLFITGSPTW
eukprot:TRINITY_DN19013_c0_g1_i1.p1 TRINITY_DN19013_c0_g1~~TRINITY_DN19013_c0_g1_i1.p1  ORF type:complete len:590 (+),score=104.39 TRINITY_DN19013_c0_g1_i1:127-1770(+)